MSKHSMNKLLSLILCMMLIAATALMFTGCGDKEEPAKQDTVTIQNGDILGTGATAFTLVVCDVEGKEVSAQIQTDKTILGEALLELGLIAGENTEFGLYLKTVNGITLDYDTDGKYWALYINDEYALTGIDSTEIEAGATYTLKAE